jgi:PKD repeat protein
MWNVTNVLSKFFLFTILILFVPNYATAQNCNAGVNITPNKTSYCAGEAITIRVNNPSNNYAYRMIINGVIYNDTVATITLPGATTTKAYDVNVQYKGFIGGFVPCIAIAGLRPTITVNPSPDPTITDISSDIGTLPFTKCGGNAPYVLSIQNNSTTASIYSQTYSINWGDGQSTGSLSSFTTLSHNYSQPGSYSVSLTVSTTGLASCNSVTKVYNAYFGVLPNVSGIGSASSTIQCIPFNAEFLIDTSISNRNPVGTFYDIFISGKRDTTFPHPAPRSIFHNFDKTSCGEGSCTAPDAYEIKIVARNSCGEKQSTTCYQINEKPDPKIQLPDTVCINDPTPHVNQTIEKQVPSTGGACKQVETVWKITPSSGWTLNSGNMNTSPTINVTYTQLGTFKVDMTVKSNSCGDSTISKNIVVVPKPNASFVIDHNKICGGNIITTTNTSVNDAIVKYQWSITPSTGWTLTSGTLNSTNIAIKFNDKGNYSIKLRAYVSLCEEEATENVLVIGVPNIDTNAIPVVCTLPHNFINNNYFIFDNGNDNASTYIWNFDNGTPNSSILQNPGTVLYNTVGTFGIFAQITNQCGLDSITLPITLFNFPKPNAGPDFDICIDADPIQLTGFSPIGGVWSGIGITDPVNAIFSPSAVGNAGQNELVYTINPTSVCPTKDTLVANIIEIVGLTAGPNQEICKGTGTLKLIGNPNFLGGNWFGTGVASSVLGIFDPTGLTPGTYQVGYAFQDASGSCRDTAYKDVLVKDSVHFIPPPDLCVNQIFNFGSLSDNIMSPTSWNFGDGSPPSFLVGPNIPTHTYTSVGLKNVRLIATTIDGCIDTLDFQINVKQNPNLSFNVSPDSACDGNIMISFPSTHEPASQYTWYYNNQNQANTDSTRFLINLPIPALADSIYQINLTAKYFCGDISVSKNVKIKSKPKAGFNITPIGCAPFNPILVNDAFGSPTTYYWHFGITGQTSILSTPTPPTYQNPHRNDTTYSVLQIVSNVCGTDSVRKKITVRANNTYANIASHITQGCEPLEVEFQSVSSDGSIQWTFGDGTFGFSAFEPKTYTQSGVFPVKLLVIGTCGRDSATSSVTVYPKPTVDFTASNQCLGTPTQFTSVTTNTVSRTWSFGDNPLTFSSLQNPTKTYSDVGNYVVKLIASSNKGCKDSIEKNITINSQPIANFVIDNPKECIGKPINFINTTVSTGSPSYTWIFGDGNTSTVYNPAPYLYTYPATYTVSLTAQEGDCKSTKTLPNAVRILPQPIADFSFTIDENQKFKAPVLFNNLSALASSYIWVFRAGDSSTQKDPSFLYGGVGPYKTTLYVENSNGCKDTITKILAIDFDGAVYTPNVFAPDLGDGTTESKVFKPKGVDLQEYHVQVFSTYGQLLWESTKLQDGSPVEAWDGTYKGQLMPQDVYVWKIRAIFKSGRAWEGMLDETTGRKTTMGSVLLLR